MLVRAAGGAAERVARRRATGAGGAEIGDSVDAAAFGSVLGAFPHIRLLLNRKTRATGSAGGGAHHRQKCE